MISSFYSFTSGKSTRSSNTVGMYVERARAEKQRQSSISLLYKIFYFCGRSEKCMKSVFVLHGGFSAAFFLLLLLLLVHSAVRGESEKPCMQKATTIDVSTNISMYATKWLNT